MLSCGVCQPEKVTEYTYEQTKFNYMLATNPHHGDGNPKFYSDFQRHNIEG